MNLNYKIFDNGIKWVHYQKPSKISHLAVLVKVGSRYEDNSQKGISHLIEHMIFKGTNHRNNIQIINRLDSVGADLNAFTTKEDTTVYASFLSEYFSRSSELISDVIFNSNFPEKELAKEKSVIIDEINYYKDNPAENIIDAFDELLFSNNSLSSNILGSKTSLNKINVDTIKKYYSNYYQPKNIIIATIDSKPSHKLEKYIKKYFGLQENTNLDVLNNVFSPVEYIPNRVTKKLSQNQCHVVMGNIAYDYYHPNRIAMVLLSNLLGGPAMNSLLSLTLREKNGIAYNIETNYNSYIDTGSFTVYFGTDEKNYEQAISIINKELKKLCSKKISENLLRSSKKQLKGQMALSMESSQNETLNMVKSFSVFDYVDTYETICNKIDLINSDVILETANDILLPSQLSILKYSNLK